MITQGFGTRTGVLRALAGNSLSIRLPKTNGVREITSIIASYSPEFTGAYPNFAQGRLLICESLFDNPSFQLLSSPTGAPSNQLGEIILDQYLWKPTTHFDFSRAGIILAEKTDYSILICMPVESASYQNFTAPVWPPAQNWQASLTVLGVGVNAKSPFDKFTTIQNTA